MRVVAHYTCTNAYSPALHSVIGRSASAFPFRPWERGRVRRVHHLLRVRILAHVPKLDHHPRLRRGSRASTGGVNDAGGGGVNAFSCVVFIIFFVVIVVFIVVFIVVIVIVIVTVIVIGGVCAVHASTSTGTVARLDRR